MLFGLELKEVATLLIGFGLFFGASLFGVWRASLEKVKHPSSSVKNSTEFVSGVLMDNASMRDLAQSNHELKRVAEKLDDNIIRLSHNLERLGDKLDHLGDRVERRN